MTLLEVIFASFIFSGMVTALSGIWVMHARAQMQSGLVLVAADLADLEMSRALAAGFHGATSSSATFTQTWEVRGQVIAHRFTSSVEVLELTDANNQPSPMKLVRVAVAYGDDPESQQRFTLESVLSDDSGS